MVELNRVDEIQRFRTYKIYGKHHLPHYGEHKLVATIHMNTGDNSLADCESLPVLFMNAQTYRDDAMRLRNEIEQKDREISRLQAGVEQTLRERDQAVEALREIDDLDGEINPSNYDHDDACYLNRQFCYAGTIASTTLASIEGTGHE